MISITEYHFKVLTIYGKNHSQHIWKKKWITLWWQTPFSCTDLQLFCDASLSAIKTYLLFDVTCRYKGPIAIALRSPPPFRTYSFSVMYASNIRHNTFIAIIIRRLLRMPLHYKLIKSAGDEFLFAFKEFVGAINSFWLFENHQC